MKTNHNVMYCTVDESEWPDSQWDGRQQP